MKKILLILGTRPEAIKLAPVYRELRRAGSCFETKLCLTGQHLELVNQVLDFFDIQADFQLGIMEESRGDLSKMTSLLLAKLKTVFDEFRPACVLVQGDTTSAFVGGLAAFYAGIKVGHVEAGLRTYDKQNPYPEEFNRVALSHLADFHFAPTELAKKHLLNEGIPEENILVCGNTIVDALLEAKSRLIDEPMHFGEGGKKILLTTIHRRENSGKVFQGICEALLELARQQDWVIVYPVHPNSNFHTTAYQMLDKHPNIRLLEPQPYGRFLQLMLRSDLILTDSGGIQEEATVLGKPVLLVRKTTERPEAVASGFVKVIGNQKLHIVEQVKVAIESLPASQGQEDIYGTGKASQCIVELLSNHLC